MFQPSYDNGLAPTAVTPSEFGVSKEAGFHSFAGSAAMTDMLHGLGSHDCDAAHLRADIAIEHWDALFDAVQARLGLAVGGKLAGTSDEPTPSSDSVQASVLECVKALGQLHALLKHGRSRRQQPEMQAVDARTAAAAALADRVGTKATAGHARHSDLHDRLTLLPNHTFFRARLDRALADAEPLGKELAVLYLDLDGFKPINDAHGREAGDELLRIVAARLTRAVRAQDIVSRLRDDVFACVLADVPTREKLSQRAWRLFDAVSAPFRIGDLKLNVRPSIGIAVCPIDGTTSGALLKSADAAMYSAKRQQSGYAFVDDGVA